MNDKELNEVLNLLSQAGLQPMVCDTQVPLSKVPVKCGQPVIPGDREADDYVMLPKALVGTHPEIFVPAVGDSMTGANFEEGDRLRIQLGAACRDGDNVLVWIDGSCTVKTFFQDEDGMQWLVPQNEAYDAILLTGQYDVRLLGRVVGVEKASPRSSFCDCQKYVRRAKTKLKMARQLTTEQVDGVLREMGAEVKHARQWYAVYRALADHQLVDEGTMASFCERVANLLPSHDHLPTARELQRMAVQSFSKPVSLWSPVNAPVSGVRFNDYLRIARLTAAKLAELSAELPF
ncbi:MAG: hypothetical protein J6Z14_12705 [Prevotella sp.]|nr:hypothetical protein [Prevotella sp.]